MANTTVDDVFNDAAALLGDEALDIYQPSVLRPAFKRAYGDLTKLFVKWGLSLPKRTAYLILPAYTSIAAPADFGIEDMGEPIDLAERQPEITVDVTSIDNGQPRQVTTSGAHGLASNTAVTLGAVFPASLGGQYFITSTGANSLSLNGTRTGEEYIGGGVLSQSSHRFIAVTLVEEVTGEPGPSLTFYSYNGETFQFRGSNRAVELKLDYLSSGAAPSSGDIAIDGSYDFLVTATAAYAGPLRGQGDRGRELKAEAFGPSMEADGSGGKLRDFVLPMLQTKNHRPRRPGTFRPRKNHASPYWMG